ncbi:hypothetical protein ACE1CI_10920 [Aerosakkonemataceae cyanobacterium BLCC-F50]|uniref:ApeA N-terminal domain-containing protein n=1 Tax=Floridaenema flaviceps BLCC-F50 TaxID=3153642 RepID=A0ABV4XNZ1_9CYAN
MSRNMIKANEYIFEVLANFGQKSKEATPVSDTTKRCIKTNNEEQEWLKEIKIIKKQLIVPNFQTASFEFNTQKYFVAVGWQSKEIVDSDKVLQFVEPNAGIVTALLFELKIPLSRKASPLEITNIMVYGSDNEVIKYEFSEIIHFFEPFSVYRIQEDYPFIENDIDLIRLSGFYTLKNSQLITLNFSGETLDKFEQIFFEGAKTIPYENLLFSLFSVSWKYSFLDIYRCIERLFSISFLEDFHKKLQITDPLLKFSADVETYIGWKPKENEAVNKIIDGSPEEAHCLLQEIKRCIDGTGEGKCGELVYKIRNSIVHFRPATQCMDLDDKNWDILIRASLYIVEHWYNQYNEQLSI